MNWSSCRKIMVPSAVFQFTLTCSYGPLFICFVSVTGSSVAPAYPHLQSIVQQVFSNLPPVICGHQVVGIVPPSIM
jgi:hypothetical protein